MAESLLAEHLATERSHAVRALLAQPLLDAEARPDDFRLVARHTTWLVDYFERTCGWALAVDAAAGFARLSKRAAEVDVSRPLRRTRTVPAPFDRRRYQLLCLIAAELVRHPVTTVGLLAGAVAAEAGLETSRQGERAAFIDALRALIGWGAVRATAGQVDAFVDNDRANALLSADTARLHRLLVSAAAPSSLPATLITEEATGRLLAEPRYGPAPDDGGDDGGDGRGDGAGDGGGGDEARNRWARHRLGRRLLDDPAVYMDDLSGAERSYLTSPSGRRWLRDRLEEAGFEVEERAEGLVAVDPDAIATDRQFPAPLGNVHQLALLLVDRLVVTGADGRRALGRLTASQLRREVDAVLARFPGWAKGQREEGGPERLAGSAVELLASFRLVRREADGAVVALPALGRYRVGEPARDPKPVPLRGACMTQTVATLSPPADRWRPRRAGLVNVWRYWDETFTFHRGRLLLRGPNGSGKSMALELLLPFLLDADASPARLTSAAKSRGGLFDRVMTGADEANRTGFAWVEFVRGDALFTVGARIRASQATRRAEADFFTTSLEIGRELHLLDSTRTPLSKRALEEAIGASGRVHDSAEQHRNAVREVLFPDFSADRYASVIGALLALRKEKLSQNLDLDKLSRVLSDALPPIDDHDIATVAEGFERLDRRRAELAALEREWHEVRQLAARQKDYACAVVVGSAGEVRSAETRRDDITRTERLARDELDAAQAEAQALGAERHALEDRDDAIGVEVDALKDSAAYREGAALADLRKQAAQLREVVTQAACAAHERTEALALAREELDQAAAGRGEAASILERAGRDVRHAAEPAGASAVVDEAELVDDADDADRLMQAWAAAQRGRVEQVRAALDAYDRAVAERDFREEQVAEDEAAVAERAVAAAAAVAAVEAALADFAHAVEEWAAGCQTLGPAHVVALLASARRPQAVADAVTHLAASAQADDAVARRDLGAEREAAAAERRGLEAERALWAGARLPDPEAVAWRADRTNREGAPLWRLVDFAAGFAPAGADGLEAALTGAGLIDAWVQPDGSVDLGAGSADIVLTARPIAGETLATALAPAPPVPHQGWFVAPDVVAAVLASVALADTVAASSDPGPNDVVIGRDGTYRLGSAVGRGPTRPAQLLGAVSRERHRLARLAEIDAARAEIDARLRRIADREADLDRRRAAIEAELAGVPSPERVDGAERAAAGAAARQHEAGVRLEAGRRALRAAEESVRGALRTLTGLGAGHGVPTDRAGLIALEAALVRLAGSAAVWARRRRELAALEREHRRAEQRASKAEGDAARAADVHAASERDARTIEGRVSALESSVGADYGTVLRRLGALEEERITARRRLRELGTRGPLLDRRVGELASKVEAAAEARHEAEVDRDRAQRRLVAAVDELGGDAGIAPGDPLDTASSVLGFARAVAADHARVDAQPQTVERLSGRVSEAVHQAQTSLGARVELDRELTENGWWVLRTAVGGVRRRAGDLSGALAAELEQGRQELVEDEERLFEQTLAGSVRRALAARIRQANDLVDHINGHLAAVRTEAGGVEVRLKWEVDPDQLDAVKAARALLLRDPADLGDDERASLQAFVRARVDQARAELEANAPWEDRLRETLDYRAWHCFRLQIGHRDWDGELRTATPRRLQKLSTGERSIALHLPMIASVAAHYVAGEGPAEAGTASVCPRLILLDELFAGVDSANRAQLFGTFTSWDLDAVFTSDHEWCQYASLDGIAIHHLHPPTGQEPVTSTRFTWDGRRRRVDPTAA